MGKRTRSQRKGSSPRYRVASHRFPGSNTMPRASDVVAEVTELIHSPVHTAPLARVKLPDGRKYDDGDWCSTNEDGWSNFLKPTPRELHVSINSLIE